jgi:hypothetical protein
VPLLGREHRGEHVADARGVVLVRLGLGVEPGALGLQRGVRGAVGERHRHVAREHLDHVLGHASVVLLVEHVPRLGVGRHPPARVRLEPEPGHVLAGLPRALGEGVGHDALGVDLVALDRLAHGPHVAVVVLRVPAAGARHEHAIEEHLVEHHTALHSLHLARVVERPRHDRGGPRGGLAEVHAVEAGQQRGERMVDDRRVRERGLVEARQRAGEAAGVGVTTAGDQEAAEQHGHDGCASRRSRCSWSATGCRLGARRFGSCP